MSTFYEFFAGGGMVRAGLGHNWNCLFANDFDAKKGESYVANWGGKELVVDDIRNIGPQDLIGEADLIWGSFPCQDLSLAGGGAGLRGDRSGTFYPFISIVKELAEDGRAPKIIALENVTGTLTSHKGKDFTAIFQALNQLNYRFGAIIVDASMFVPHSRPRLFVVAIRNDVILPKRVLSSSASKTWHTAALKRAVEQLPSKIRANWIWWNMPVPATREIGFSDLIEENPKSVKWHSKSETTTLLSMMSEVNLAKVETAKHAKIRMVGTIYKRTRLEHGIKVQRAEVRFDNIAGCLRTPTGGSSRQLIIVVEGETIRTRLISARETARLMGLNDSYKLPERYNQAYHLTGDGVAVPVVKHISETIFSSILEKNRSVAKAH